MTPEWGACFVQMQIKISATEFCYSLCLLCIDLYFSLMLVMFLYIRFILENTPVSTHASLRSKPSGLYSCVCNLPHIRCILKFFFSKKGTVNTSTLIEEFQEDVCTDIKTRTFS